METNFQSTKSSQLNFWANLLFIIGFVSFMFGSFLLYQRYNPQNLSFNISPVQAVENNETLEVKPIGIKINSLNLSLPVIPSEIKNNEWEATTKGVSYLTSSVTPGETGNSILYGHNWASLLGNLRKVKPGEKIAIIYSDGSVKEFLIEYAIEVKPDNGDILQNSSDSRITLYTCSGFLDSKRLVVVAKLLV